MSGWNHGRQKGMGLAYSHYADSPIACVVAVSLSKLDQTLQVDGVWLAADVGIVIQPDTVRAQLEGGATFGLSNALQEQIEIIDGVPTQTNFHQYQLLRMQDAPRIRVELLKSEEPPSGVGEIATVVTPPALANAIASLTGKRLRHLPFTTSRVANALQS
jgi:isoquinoline 1-oxidoreductase beta subunit